MLFGRSDWFNSEVISKVIHLPFGEQFLIITRVALLVQGQYVNFILIPFYLDVFFLFSIKSIFFSFLCFSGSRSTDILSFCVKQKKVKKIWDQGVTV